MTADEFLERRKRSTAQLREILGELGDTLAEMRQHMDVARAHLAALVQGEPDARGPDAPPPATAESLQ